MKKELKDKEQPKGETPFGKFEQLAKKVVVAPKIKIGKADISEKTA